MRLSESPGSNFQQPWVPLLRAQWWEQLKKQPVPPGYRVTASLRSVTTGQGRMPRGDTPLTESFDAVTHELSGLTAPLLMFFR